MKKSWPQPTTPLRGDVAEITFALYQRAKTGAAPPAVQKLFNSFGSYRVKPKRNSRGVVWNNRAFWWSFKGYYRPGFKDGCPRRPLQHYVWERAHGRKMPRLFEIWFVDRDHHNFEISNLECLHKSEVHKRCIALGEVRQPTLEERRKIAGKRWTRHSRNATSILLQNFNRGSTQPHKSNGNSTKNILAIIRERTNKEDRIHTRKLARASRSRRIARQAA